MKAFEDTIQKYVRLPGNEIIIFSMLLQHSTFIDIKPVTAGICIIDPEKKKVNCFGQSMTLLLQADEVNDTRLATLQIFGDEMHQGLKNENR